MGTEVQAWCLVGAGVILGLLALALSRWMPVRRKPAVMEPGNLGAALDVLRQPIQLPDGRWVKFEVNAVFHRQAPRSAA